MQSLIAIKWVCAQQQGAEVPTGSGASELELSSELPMTDCPLPHQHHHIIKPLIVLEMCHMS